MTVRVTDLAGRTVCRRTFEAPASGILTWDPRGESGARFSPGVCFYEVSAGAARRTGRFVVAY